MITTRMGLMALALGMSASMWACTATATKGDVGGADGGGTSADPTPGAAPGSAPGSMDASIVGQWYAGRGGTTISYDPTTGQLGAPSGTGMLFVFQEDGSYVKGVQSMEDGPCTMGYVTTESGTVTTSGGELTLHPKHGNMHTITCSHAADKDSPLETHEETLAWSLGPFSQDPSTPALTLRNAAGASAEFRRTR